MGPTLSPFSDPVALIVSALAVYRLTRLLVSDKVTERPREALARIARDDAHPKLAYFITCPWCVSMWVAAGWSLLLGLAHPVALVAGAILAWSAVAGLLSSWE